MKIFYAAFFILITSFISSPQTHVSGNQSGVWSLSNSPYLVDGEITVQQNDSLIIEPGVKVVFLGYFRFVVNGYLQAIGTEADSIIFTTNNPSTGWHGIRFIDADSSSRLSFCKILFGKSSGDWHDNSGGGVSLWDSGITIDHCLFKNNHADYLGGALFCWGGSPVINDCVFTNNDCDYDGGAVYFYFADAVMNNCRIIDNTTFYYGAAVSCEQSYATLNRCLIANNGSQAEGGAMWIHYTDLKLVNCTITDNSTFYGYGNAIYVTQSTANIINSILWNDTGNGDEIYLDVEGYVNVNYTDIQGNWQGTGNYDVDPAFIDSANYDFHLSENSPCIDAGTAFFVLDGDTLINIPDSLYYGTAPDMGAFEYYPPVYADNSGLTIKTFYLEQNYPNPFNPTTTIRFQIPEATHVLLKIYDINGKEIRTLIDEDETEGIKTVTWNGRDNNGRQVSSGVYFYRLISAKGFYQSRKLILLK